MTYLRTTENPSGNGVQSHERVVLEKAMEVIYGTGIWNEINELSKKIKG